MKKMNNKGFTLIEILGAIAILAILMGISISAISRVVNKSRKEVYVDMVRIQKKSMENLIASEKYYVYDENTVYYFDYHLINDEEALKSPFADWESAYVVVTCTGDQLTYYWTGIDKAGWKINLRKPVTELEAIDVYNVQTGHVIPGASIGARDKVVIYNINEDTGKVEELEQGTSNEMSMEEVRPCFTIQENNVGTYSIIDYNEECGTEVNVPSSIDGKVVSIIEENAFKSKNLTKVTLYHGITEIKSGAFQANNINELKLSPSVATIGSYAFYNNKLVTIDFPEGLQKIDSYAFAYNLLEEVHFPKSLTTIGGRAFYGNKLTDIEIVSNVSIGGAAFSGNKMSPSKSIIYKFNGTTTDYTTIVGYAGSEKDVVIPEMVNGVAPTTIESSAFASTGLKSVVIPNSVTTIKSAAFYSNSLTSITLPTSLTTIGSEAFRSNLLSSVDIPPSVTSIGYAAFVYNCFPEGEDIIYARNSDGSVDYSKIISGAGGRVSGTTCQGNRNLKIPAEKNGVKLKTINNNAFMCCSYLSYELPDLSQTDGLTIGTNAFYINSFSADQAFVYKVANGAIDYSEISSYGGTRTGTLKIPKTKNGVDLKTIDASFTCTSFTSIEVPSSVTTFRRAVFSKSKGCNTKLEEIINKTGQEFDWYYLTGSSRPKPNPVKFETGEVSHIAGDVRITK